MALLQPCLEFQDFLNPSTLVPFEPLLALFVLVNMQPKDSFDWFIKNVEKIMIYMNDINEDFINYFCLELCEYIGNTIKYLL